MKTDPKTFKFKSLNQALKDIPDYIQLIEGNSKIPLEFDNLFNL